MSRDECLKYCPQVIDKAKIKFKRALEAADDSDYDSAVSMLIVSNEIMSQAFFLYLDGVGFEFRKMKGMKNFFNNHNLRYQFALVNSMLVVLGEDAAKFLARLFMEPGFMKNILESHDLGDAFTRYIKEATLKVLHEIELISEFDKFRQIGTYADYHDGFQSVSLSEYQRILGIVEKLNKMLQLIMGELKEDEPRIDLLNTFKEEDYYAQLEASISKVSDKKYDSYEELRKVVLKTSGDLQNEKFISEITQLPKKLLTKFPNVIPMLADMQEKRMKYLKEGDEDSKIS